MADDNCTWYKCTIKAEANGYCFLHNAKMGNPKSEKVKAPILKVSVKRKLINKEYKKIKDSIISTDKGCKIKSPVCTGSAQGLNHIQKRSPKNLIVLNNLVACCNACNSYLETNDAWARKNGHTVSRFKK